MLERLELLGVAEQTAVVFVTDHVFYFGEHGGLFGKMLRLDTRVPNCSPWARSPLYEECVHIPLLVRVPGLPVRRVQLTSAIDLMPSVLDLLGVAVPEGLRLHGRSFVLALEGDTTGGHQITMTSMPLTNPGELVGGVDSVYRNLVQYQPVTVTTTEWALRYAAQGEPVELYHLPDDPAQAHDVAGQHPGVVQDLHGAFVTLLEETKTTEEYLAPRRAL